MKKKILFIVEAITWSQVVRLMVLARGLDPRKYEVHFASARSDERLFHGTSFRRWLITSPSVDELLASLHSAKNLYPLALLEKYVSEELRLYEAIHPDLVVQDTRWSTTVSTPLFGVPCATLINGYYMYWRRRTTHKRFPLLDHPLLKLLSPSIAQKYVVPIVTLIMLRRFAAPVNQLRRKHGLPEIGNYIDVITWGDRLLFPDDPLIVPLTDLAPHETFLGPLLWSPQIPLPEYWDELGRDRLMVYATLGSSGRVKEVPAVLEALGGMDVDVVFSTAAHAMPKHLPPNVHVVDMIPGDLAARKAAVVVCNGGASTAYQALAEGTPIVGIPSNTDQLLAATAMRDAGVGVVLHASTANPAQIRTAVERVMHEEGFTKAAQRVAASSTQLDPHARFRAVADDVIAHGGTAAGTVAERNRG
ncbi:MAG: glycosyltransferase [Halobacteriota archaeon]